MRPTEADRTSASQRPPHVLFVGHGAERTGPPILLDHLLRGLAETHDWRRSVVVARNGPMAERYRASGATATAVSDQREPLEPLSAGLRRIGLAGLARRLQNHRRRVALRGVGMPDLVYLNAATRPTADLVRAMPHLTGLPTVLHVHELDIGLREGLTDRDRALLFSRADRIIAASSPVAQNLIHGHGVDADRVVTCDVFVDVAALHPVAEAEARAEMGVPDDVPLVGSVGLPDWRKDPGHLLRAISMMEAPTLPWVVWIGGDPHSTDGRQMANEAHRLGLANRFRHVPHTEDPSRLLGALDVFALPAREDAMPLAALEAAAIGIPVVCFRTGGIAALCDRGAGTAVDYPDTVGFGRAIARYVGDAKKRAQTGRRAAELVVENHDRAIGTARIEDVLCHLLRVPGLHQD